MGKYRGARFNCKDELPDKSYGWPKRKRYIQAIAERFEVGQNKARRLVRTESAFFHNQMELLSYEDAEITKYKFVAVLDKRTSHICQEHDNKVYDTDKAVLGVNYPTSTSMVQVYDYRTR